MHGVKRLFAWMIPRFDPERYNVSLVSLRKKDLSEETLESFGVDITYLHRSKFDPATLAGAAEGDRSQEDRRPAPPRIRRDDVRPDGRRDAAAADDPARARQPDRYAMVPEGRGHRARAVHRHRDRGVAEHGGLRDPRPTDSASQGQSRVPRRAARGIQPRPIGRGRPGRARGTGHRARRRGDRHGDPAARLEGQLISRRRRSSRVERAAGCALLHCRGRAASRIRWNSRHAR